MTRRTKRVFGGLAGVLAAAAVTVAIWPGREPYPRLTTFRRVTVGMTRDEVYATVGKPPGVYDGSEAVLDYDGLLVPDGGHRGGGIPATWLTTDGRLDVWFTAEGPDGRVVEVTVSDGDRLPPTPSPFERLRIRLGL